MNFTLDQLLNFSNITVERSFIKERQITLCIGFLNDRYIFIIEQQVA